MSDEQIGTATMQRQGDRVVVLQADRVIAVAPALLHAEDLDPWVWDGETLTLDSDGEYRYRQIGRRFLHASHEELIFERIEDPS